MVCSKCNAINAADAAFCEACGSSLVASPTAATEGSSAPAAPSEAAPVAASPAPSPAGEFLPGEAPSHRISGASAPTIPNDPLAPPAPPRGCVECGGEVDDEYCTVCGAKQPSPRDHFEIVRSDRLAGVCDRGIQHAANQDAMAILAGPSPDTAVLVVCDGVTSAPLSERASLAAAEAACSLLGARFSADRAARTGEYWAAALRESCVAAQAQTVAVARTLGDPIEPPSCTFVAAVIDGPSVHVGSCGDSRAYWLPDSGSGQILSVDDSIASQLIAAGTPRADAEADARAHTITRWLGADAPDPSARVTTFPLDQPGWVAVVSDGMWNYASEPTDLQQRTTEPSSRANTSPSLTALHVALGMVDFANGQGGADNITVALFRHGPLPAPAPAPQTSAAEAPDTVPSHITP